MSAISMSEMTMIEMRVEEWTRHFIKRRLFFICFYKIFVTWITGHHGCNWWKKATTFVTKWSSNYLYHFFLHLLCYCKIIHCHITCQNTNVLFINYFYTSKIMRRLHNMITETYPWMWASKYSKHWYLVDILLSPTHFCLYFLQHNESSTLNNFCKAISYRNVSSCTLSAN